MRIRRVILAVSALAMLATFATGYSQNFPSREGFVKVDGGRIWYRIVGNGKGTPLLLLHGGPGVPSYYLKPLEALADERQVIFYDQLGCGHSDHPTDTTLWRTERFVKELAEVRAALGLKEVYLYGHSWGTILAAEYMFTKPAGVKGLIFASPALDVHRWEMDAESLLTTLPDSLQKAIKVNERNGTTSSPVYMNAVNEYYNRFLARKGPWSADIDSSFSQMSQDAYTYMNGPSEFTVTGTLRTYDCTSRLHEIKVPTLFTAGQYDEAQPATVKYFQSLIPGSKLAIIPNCGHLTMQDDPAGYVKALRQFLDSTDKR